MLEDHAIKYLNEFVTLADTGNYDRAADQLYLSKSALTKHIRDLENSFGEPLFSVSGHKLALTEPGQFLLAYAQRFVNLDNEYKTELNQFRADKSKEVRIAVSAFLNCDHMVNMLWDHFSETHEGYHLSTDEYHIDSLSIDHLFAMDYELVFSLSDTPECEQYNCYNWAESTMSAILPFSHPLADREAISLSDLADESFILFPKETSMHRYIVELCHRAGFDPKVSFTIYGKANLVELVSSSLGVSIASDNELKVPSFHEKVAVIPLNPPSKIYLNLYYRKDVPLTPAAETFLNYAIDMHETHENDIPYYGPEVGVENVFF